MEHSPAYEIGRMIGALILAVVLAASLAGYSFGLWKFAKSRHVAWLAVTILLGLPLLGLVVLFFCVGAITLVKGAKEIGQPARSNEASSSLTHKFDKVEGAQFDYSVMIPDLPEWKVNTKSDDFDQIFSNRGVYFGIIAEHIGLGDTEAIRKVAEQHIADSSTAHSIGKAKTVTIAGLPWTTFDAEVTLNKLVLKYRFYVYADSRRTLQMIAWSSPATFDRNTFLIDQIATSFRLGKVD